MPVMRLRHTRRRNPSRCLASVYALTQVVEPPQVGVTLVQFGKKLQDIDTWPSRVQRKKATMGCGFDTFTFSRWSGSTTRIHL